MGVADLMAVLVVVNVAAAVEVVPDGVAGLCVGQYGTMGSASLVNLCLVLPDAAIGHTAEVADGVAFLHQRYV